MGGGPAGSSAACALAAAGARTLVLEKAQHPRYKACGGGLPLRTLRLLDTPVDAVVEGAVDTLEVTRFGTLGFSKRSTEPFALMVMRDRFDALLLDRAEAAGAIVRQGEAVQRLVVTPDGVRVQTAEGEYGGRFLVGADGATGVTARTLAPRLPGIDTMAQSAAWEMEIAAPAGALTRWTGRANVDVGYRPWGYGWVFPKAGRLSVGVVLSLGRGRSIREWTDTYLDRLGLRGAEVALAKGHPVRYRRGSEPVAWGPALLSGDAGGLADEFTAEGIAYAVESGQLAAAAILTALGSDGEAAGRYTTAIDQRIQPELDAARTISRLYYWCVNTWPGLALRVSSHLDYLWHAFFRVMRGESTYAAEVRRIPGLALAARAL